MGKYHPSYTKFLSFGCNLSRYYTWLQRYDRTRVQHKMSYKRKTECRSIQSALCEKRDCSAVPKIWLMLGFSYHSTGFCGKMGRAKEQGKLVESALGAQYERQSRVVSHSQIFMWLLGSEKSGYKGFSLLITCAKRELHLRHDYLCGFRKLNYVFFAFEQLHHLSCVPRRLNGTHVWLWRKFSESIFVISNVLD